MLLQLLGAFGLAALSGAPLYNDLVTGSPVTQSVDGAITTNNIYISSFNNLGLNNISRYCYIGITQVGDSLYSHVLYNNSTDSYEVYADYCDSLMDGSFLDAEGFDTEVAKSNISIMVRLETSISGGTYSLQNFQLSFIFGGYQKNTINEIYNFSFSKDYVNYFLYDWNMYFESSGYNLMQYENHLDWLNEGLAAYPQVCLGDNYYISYTTVAGSTLPEHDSIYPVPLKLELYPQTGRAIQGGSKDLYLAQLGFNISYRSTIYNFDNSDIRVYEEGYNTGYEDGYGIGWGAGYLEGYDLAAQTNSTATTIFSGIINIALIPINFFLACLNFEVFGINIGGAVSALLTVAIVFILCRTIFSGGNGKGD